MKMKVNKSWLERHLTELRSSNAEITRLQGSTEASVLMIAPPPTGFEVSKNLAWCGPSAEVFFEMMRAVVPLTPNQFLIIPASFRRKTTKMFKPSDADLGRAILADAAKSQQIKAFVCIGGEAFKAYFGFGRKPSMDTLVGTVLRVTQTNFKPLLVFPDTELLLFDAFKAKQEKIMPYRDITRLSSAKLTLLRMFEQRELFQKLEGICR